jgi:hypothetical protein
MLLRVSTYAPRRMIVVVAAMLATALSYSSIRNARAEHFAGLNTLQGFQRATQLEPGNARNWYFLGRYWQYSLEEADTPRAIAAYRNALSFNPRSADAWLDLATAYEFEGDLPAARSAFLQAKHAYPLSAEVSWRYGNFLLRQNELDPAFAEIRHSVEVDPRRAPEAFSRSIRVVPDINLVLDRALPPASDVYLLVILGLCNMQQTDQALTVWSRLAAIHPHISMPSSYPLIDLLIQKKQFREAHRIWNQALGFAGISPPQDQPGSVLWDGGFEANIPGGAFSWRYPQSVGGVQIALDAQEKHSGSRSLRLVFTGRQNINFSDVCQYVAVTPAVPYRFSAWIRTRALTTDQGVRFGLHAVSDSASPVVWTDDLRGTQPWTRIELPWTAGKDVQGLLLCVSRLPSAKFDSMIQGTAWIDDASLVPQSAESPHP